MKPFSNLNREQKALLLCGLGIAVFVLLFKTDEGIYAGDSNTKNFDVSKLPPALKPPKKLEDSDAMPAPFVKFNGFVKKERFETFYK